MQCVLVDLWKPLILLFIGCGCSGVWFVESVEYVVVKR